MLAKDTVLRVASVCQRPMRRDSQKACERHMKTKPRRISYTKGVLRFLSSPPKAPQRLLQSRSPPLTIERSSSILFIYGYLVALSPISVCLITLFTPNQDPFLTLWLYVEELLNLKHLMGLLLVRYSQPRPLTTGSLESTYWIILPYRVFLPY